MAVHAGLVPAGLLHQAVLVGAFLAVQAYSVVSGQLGDANRGLRPVN